MNLTFSAHALNRCFERNISLQRVADAIFAGSLERYGDRRILTHGWLRVVAVVRDNSCFVVTGIRAGCPSGGVVLDPFFGAGTGVVCVEEGRRYLGIEINPDYVAMAERRIETAEVRARAPMQASLLQLEAIPSCGTGKRQGGGRARPDR